MTRTELLTVFERYLKRNDLTDLYEDFITMAEGRINAVMRLREMETRSTSTPTDAFWALPDDYLELRHVQATVSNGSKPLEYVPPELADLQRRRLSGDYAFYTLLDDSIEIIPHPTSESATVVEIFYYAKPTTLAPAAAATTSNDISTNYPNLYLYAMLIEAALYREADKAAAMWADTFDSYARQLNGQADAARYSGNSIQMRAV